MIPANGKMSLTKSRILRKKDSVREMWLSQRAKLTETETGVPLRIWLKQGKENG